MSETDQPASPYPLFMLGLCVYALGALATQSFFQLDADTLAILDAADFLVCLVFLVDFARSLYIAPNRWRYFVTWGWIDLLSSIPAVDWLRWGRAARALRILRLLRGLRAARVLAFFALERRAQSTLLGTVLVAALAVVFGSIAIHQVEAGPGANIETGADALWWAFVTMTTVGYGDHYPVTTTGRMLAALLMVVGIGVFGTFTAYVASWFVDAGDADQDQQLVEIRAELQELRALVERR